MGETGSAAVGRGFAFVTTWLSRSVDPRPLDLWRAFVGLVSIVWFALYLGSIEELVGPQGLIDAQLAQRLFGIPLSPFVDSVSRVHMLMVLLVVGVALGGAVASGWHARVSALALLVVTVATTRSLSIAADSDDYALAVALFWTALLPVGKNLRVGNWGYRTKAGSGAPTASGVVPRLFMFGLWIAHIAVGLGLANGFAGVASWAIIDAALWTFVLWRRRYFPIAAIGHIALHVHLAMEWGTPLLSLVFGGGLFLGALSLSPGTPGEGAARRASLNGSALVAVAYLTALVPWLASTVPYLQSLRTTAGHLLFDLGLLPPPSLLSARTRRWERPPPVVFSVESGVLDTDGSVPRSRRGRTLLRRWLSSSGGTDAEVAISVSIRQRMATLFCRGKQQAHGPLAASWADGSTFMRFACTGDHQAHLLNDDGAPTEGLATHAAATHATFPAFAPAADANHRGSDSCAECHRSTYESWRASAHGHAFDADAAPLLADFDAMVRLPSASVRTYRRENDRYMEIRTPAQVHHYRVTGVLGTGRQQQAFIASTEAGDDRLMPLLWSIEAREWLPTALFYPDPFMAQGRIDNAPRLSAVDCPECHSSQPRTTFNGQDRKTKWREANVNCESCHDPAARHAGTHPTSDAHSEGMHHKSGSAEDELRTCGRCHGRRSPYSTRDLRTGKPGEFFVGLLDDRVRPDGSPLAPASQLAGLSVSRCHVEGGVRCSDCHSPHNLDSTPPMTVPLVDTRCVNCHKELRSVAAAALHSHHASPVSCVACHMPKVLFRGDARTHLSMTSHAISIPRPRESDESHAANACRTCHAEQTTDWLAKALESWGTKAAGETRGWVLAIAKAQGGRHEAKSALIEALATKNGGTTILASLLEFIALAPRADALPDSFERYAMDPSREIRSAALAALLVHDRTNAARWRAQVQSEPDPLVRLMSIELSESIGEASLAEQERYLGDIFDCSRSAPFAALGNFINVLKAQRQPLRAMTAVDWALSYTREDEALAGIFRDIRASLAAEWGLATPRP
jgi:hypothetical protein